MKMYIQTGENNRITDIITYPYDGYVEVEVEPPLPPRVLGGAYELLDGMIVYRPEWDTDEKIQTLEQEIEQLKSIVAELQSKSEI